MRIGTKFRLILLSIGLISGLVSGILMFNSQQVLEQMNSFPEESLPELNHLEALKFNASKLVIGLIAQNGPLVIMDAEENIRNILEEMEEMEAKDDDHEQLTNDSEEEQEAIEQLSLLADSLFQTVVGYQQAIYDGKFGPTHQVRLQKMWLQFDEKVDARMTSELEEFEENYEAAQLEIEENWSRSLLIIGFGLLILGLFSFVLERMVVTPIHQLNSFIGNMVEKQKFEIIPTQRKDEIGTLTKSFNNLISNLNSTLVDLKSTNSQLVNSNKLMNEHNRELEERNQQILHQSAKIDVQNKDLQGFAHVVSHDLKTPLRGMVNLATWVKEEYEDKLDERGVEYLDLISSRSTHLYDLVNGILAYSKNADLEFEAKEEIVLQQFLKDTTELLIPLGDIDLILPKENLVITTSKIAVQQIFQNLIGNAINYSDKKIPRVEIDFEETPDTYCFSVTDNGPGIDSKYHNKIFDLFQTLGQKDRNQQEGTGIGLALIKRIVGKLGGGIEVESTPNEGCTFSFWIKK